MTEGMTLSRQAGDITSPVMETLHLVVYNYAPLPVFSPTRPRGEVMRLSFRLAEVPEGYVPIMDALVDDALREYRSGTTRSIRDFAREEGIGLTS
jgi:hypothetical protein